MTQLLSMHMQTVVARYSFLNLYNLLPAPCLLYKPHSNKTCSCIFTYFKGRLRQTENERERFSIHGFTPPMPTSAGAEKSQSQSQSQKPRTPSWAPMGGRGGPQDMDLHLLPSQVYSQEVRLNVNHQDSDWCSNTECGCPGKQSNLPHHNPVSISI